MRFTNDLTDSAALAELGTRLAQARIAAELTQAEVATEAGVGLATVKRLEAGRSVSTERLLRVLRALGLLAALEELVPAPAPSPLELLERGSAGRRRVRHPKGAEDADEQPWRWGD